MSIWRGSKSSIACILPCAGSLGSSSLVTMRASPPWNFWRGMRLGRSQNPWQPRKRGDNDGKSRASEVRRHAPTPRQPERTVLGWCGEAQGGCQGVDHVPWGGRTPCRAHVFRLTQGARRTPCDTCHPSSTTPKAWRASGPSMAQTGPFVHHVTVLRHLSQWVAPTNGRRRGAAPPCLARISCKAGDLSGVSWFTSRPIAPCDTLREIARCNVARRATSASHAATGRASRRAQPCHPQTT